MALFDFRWPDEINLQAYSADQYVELCRSVDSATTLFSGRRLLLASSELSKQSHQFLLALLQIRQIPSRCISCFVSELATSLGNSTEAKILRVLAHLKKRELDELKQLSNDFWTISDMPHADDHHQLLLVRAMSEFAVGNKEVSALLLQKLSIFYSSCFEAQLLKSRLMQLSFSSMRP